MKRLLFISVVFVALAILYFSTVQCPSKLAYPVAFLALMALIDYKHIGIWMVYGLVFSALGDWQGTQGNFFRQMALFGLAHIAYICYFASRLENKDNEKAGWATWLCVLIGVAASLVVGIMIAMSRTWDNLLSPIINMVGPIPVFAFLPMFLIWFGIGEASKIALIAYATFVPMLIYIIGGIRETDPLLIRSAKSLGATSFQIFTKVILNSAMPKIFEGMKMSLALTFSALVVAEMMGASSGLGYIIVNAKNWFKMADMFLAATLIGLEYTLFYAFLTLVERRLFRWKMAGSSNAVEK